MSAFGKPLQHQDPQKKNDEELAKEARGHLAASPPLQLMAELLTKLRAMDFAWWSPDKLRHFAPAAERMAWFEQRPDLRQQITTTLTGYAPKATRKRRNFPTCCIPMPPATPNLPLRCVPFSPN